jgi:hypothetical protein
MVLLLLSVAGPTVVAVAHALVPLVLVAGAVVAVLRLVWFYTRD